MPAWLPHGGVGMWILANRSWLIGLTKPCEASVFRMVGVMSYALNIEFTHDDALKHKAALRSIINHYAKTRPRPPELPRIQEYVEVGKLDGATRRFAYGDATLPPSVDMYGADATLPPSTPT